MTELAQGAADEVRSLAKLAFRELGDAAGGLYGFHRAIAARAFAATGPGAIPVRVVHDAISTRVYGGVGGAFRLVGASGGGRPWHRAPREPLPRRRSKERLLVAVAR